MPPGQTIPANLSWTVAKQILSQQDIERLACAFLNATNPVDFDAVKAGREFGNVKPDSFKRSIWVIAKKIKDSKGGDGGEAGKVNTLTKGNCQRGGGRKRKATSEHVEGHETPRNRKGGGRGKKTKVAMDVDDHEAAIGIKSEAISSAGSDSEGDLV